MISFRALVSVFYFRSKHALLIREWMSFELGVLDHKHYVRGIGTVREEAVRGPQERLLLVSVRRR